jgi:hypothetical protein
LHTKKLDESREWENTGMNNPNLAGSNKKVSRISCATPAFQSLISAAASLLGRSRVEEEKAACWTPPYRVGRGLTFLLTRPLLSWQNA